MKHFLLIAFFTFSVAALQAQTAEDSVKNTINTLFLAMKNADADLLKTCFADSAILQTISRNKEGNVMIRTDAVNTFATSIASLKKDFADERIIFESIKMDGPLASVWTPYSLYLDGKFSHCGVNSFQLVRIKGEWKIQYLIDTRRRTGCSN
jgi:hypothetical protein